MVMNEDKNQSRAQRELLLIGSVPMPTVDDVFGACGHELGHWLAALPDGEVGERLSWTVYLHTKVFSRCADLDRVSKPATDNQERPPDHKHRWNASMVNPADFDTYRIRKGVNVPDFGDMYFGNVAIASYQRFKALRKEGSIPKHMRFQVCVPGTTSAIDEHFIDPSDWPAARLGYQKAVAAEIARMLNAIPAEDLVIQLDLAWEVMDMSLGDAPTFPWSSARSLEEKLPIHVEGIAALAAAIPEPVGLGLHWCYGTWGGWPMNEMKDMRLCTDLTLATLKATKRPIDYVHIPVALDPGEGFFDALDDLADSPCKIYLGLIHHGDGIEGFRRRWEQARPHLPSAGIASVCGFGRMDPSLMPQVLSIHRAAAEELEADR
jgi:hypothetical protein